SSTPRRARNNRIGNLRARRASGVYFSVDEFPRSYSRSTSSEIDLYCLACGYNLRGLSGDPRRCPECGHLNPVGDLMVPASEIAKQLTAMETIPVVCVSAIVVILGCVAVPVGMFLSGNSNSETALACYTFPGFVAGGLLIW